MRQACVAVSLAFLPVAALAGEPTRTWEFDLTTPGTYKLQVEHSIPDAPGTTVSYTVSVGSDTKTRQFPLVTNRPFIPLVVDIPSPRKMRVVVAGLSDIGLKQTRAYAYNADYVPYSEYFDPSKDHGLRDIETLRKLLMQPSEELDLGRFKLAVDKLVDPGVDIEMTLTELDAMAQRIQAMPGFGATPTSKAIALQRFIYTPGAWNGHRPFEYDLDDPLGANPKNKLLTTYLSSRRGNCVTMPFLFIILGQRLGIEVTASTAPNHLLVKFRNELGTWINLEATSGANPAREVWIRQQSPTITDKAIENGIYLQPLSKKETAAVIAGLLAEHYLRQEQYHRAIATADALLEYYPKNVGMMTMKGASYGRLARKYFAQRGPSANTHAPLPAWYYEHLSKSNYLWFAKAEGLGWREETKTERERYLQQIRSTRQHKTNEAREVQ